MEEFLEKLGISEPVEQSEDGHFVVNIENSNQFAKIYSKLDKSNLVTEDEESSLISTDTLSVQYLNDEYLLTLLGDLENNIYSLTIKPIGK